MSPEPGVHANTKSRQRLDPFANDWNKTFLTVLFLCRFVILTRQLNI